MTGFAAAPAKLARNVRLGSGDGGAGLLSMALVVGVLIAATTLASTRFGSSVAVALPIGALICLYLVASPNLALSLGIIGLYIGLLDGYLKLSTGSNLATVGRDLLIYSVVVGAVVRIAVKREPLTAPKYFTHVLLLVVLVLVQALNPETPGLKGTIGGVKQHLEFVPLFFLAFAVVRTERRLQQYLLLLVLIVAANAVVAVIQSGLTPEQLAGWGPGYSEKVLGTGDFVGAGRNFSDTSGTGRVRPFGLGSDLGAGGAIGGICVGVGLALFGASRARWLRIAGVVGIVGSAAAVFSSQSRLAVVIGVFALLVYGLVSASSRQATRTFAVLIVGGFIVYGAISVLFEQSGSGSADRFSTITPGRLAETVQQDRGSSLVLIPKYALDYPVGAGLGRGGPAAGFGGANAGLNGENSFNLLITELGTAGLVVYLSLWLRVLYDGARAVRRIENRRAQLFLAALVTGVTCILLSWFAGSPTTTTPTSPFFWIAAGIIAWAGTAGSSAFPAGRTALSPVSGS